MRRRATALGMLLSLLPATCVARAVAAQPVVQNERPARFVLTGGGVVVGSKIGEDAEYYLVQTPQGVVRVRKTDVASIDFGGGAAGGPAVSPPQPPAVAPAPVDDRYPGGTRRGERVFTAGLWTLVGVYIAVALTGAIISIENPDANWMLVPIAGPLLFYKLGDLERNVFGILLLTTIVEGAAAAAMLVGAVLMGTDGGSASRGLHLAEGVDVAPFVGPQGGGFVVSGRG